MAQSLPHTPVCKTPSTPDDAAHAHTRPPATDSPAHSLARPLVEAEIAGIKHKAPTRYAYPAPAYV